MKNLKVTAVTQDYIEFDGGVKLWSGHEPSCCEEHFLYFNDLTLEDFKDLMFDLSADDTFVAIPDYGVELVPLQGHSIKIPGYGYNNGYYTSNLFLVLTKLTTTEAVELEDVEYKRYNITPCQKIEEYGTPEEVDIEKIGENWLGYPKI